MMKNCTYLKCLMMKNREEYLKIKWKNFFSVSEVECEVSSQVEYSMQAIWGVSIRELHLALWKPWNTLRDASLNGTLLQGHAQHLTPPRTYPLLKMKISICKISPKIIFLICKKSLPSLVC